VVLARARRRIPIRERHCTSKPSNDRLSFEDPRQQHRIVLDDEHALFHNFSGPAEAIRSD